MATLDDNERRQLRQAVEEPRLAPRRWERQPIKDYLSFSRFASRFTLRDRVIRIDKGNHWKL